MTRPLQLSDSCYDISGSAARHATVVQEDHKLPFQNKFFN